MPTRAIRQATSPALRTASSRLVAGVRALGLSLVMCGLVAMDEPDAAAQPDGDVPILDTLDEPIIDDSLGLDDDVLVDDLADLFSDMPIVISAARVEQPINMSSVAVTVIDADDIRYGGLVTLEELFYFANGVDVLRFDRNRYGVGVRGLHDTFSDRTLSLLNGRAADSHASGGPEFFRLPLFPGDIERIEVVRGPGGAAWGANAFSGVINVITKRPDDPSIRGVTISSTLNEYGETSSFLRIAGGDDQLSYRVSTGYRNHESSDEAIGGDSFFSRDFGRDQIIDTEFLFHVDEENLILAGFGYSDLDRGDYSIGTYFPQEDEDIRTLRSFVRFEHNALSDADASGYVQWFGNFQTDDRPSLTTYRSTLNDIEAQLNLPSSDGHTMTIGGNFRYGTIDTSLRDPQQIMFLGEPLNEQWAGVFFIDRWQRTSRHQIEAQARVDWYSEIGFDWSGRLTSLHALDDDQRSVLRFSAASAFRSPLVALRRIQMNRAPVAPGIFGFQVFPPNGELENEGIRSFEAGFTTMVTPELALDVQTYYQIYEDLIGFDPLPDPLLLGRQLFRPDNIDGAEAIGGEVELTRTFEGGHEVSAWYNYHEFEPDNPLQATRSALPARHKAGVSTRLKFEDQWVVQGNYRYSDFTRAQPSEGGGTDSFHRVDLAVSKAFESSQAEILVGVSDIFDDTDVVASGIGDTMPHETPGRTAFVRFQVRF